MNEWMDESQPSPKSSKSSIDKNGSTLKRHLNMYGTHLHYQNEIPSTFRSFSSTWRGKVEKHSDLIC